MNGLGTVEEVSRLAINFPLLFAVLLFVIPISVLCKKSKKVTPSTQKVETPITLSPLSRTANLKLSLFADDPNLHSNVKPGLPALIPKPPTANGATEPKPGAFPAFQPNKQDNSQIHVKSYGEDTDLQSNYRRDAVAAVPAPTTNLTAIPKAAPNEGTQIIEINSKICAPLEPDQMPENTQNSSKKQYRSTSLESAKESTKESAKESAKESTKESNKGSMKESVSTQPSTMREH